MERKDIKKPEILKSLLSTLYTLHSTLFLIVISFLTLTLNSASPIVAGGRSFYVS